MTADRTGRRLGLFLSGYLVAIVGVITLAPFRFVRPDHFVFRWLFLADGWLADILLNVALFIPLGIVLRRAMPGVSDRLGYRVLLAGGAVSACIEAAQLMIPPRYSTASDVVANALGAWIGAMLSDLVSRRVGEDRVLVGRLRLDLPLMGVVYLLAPLLWLGGLTADSSAASLQALVPLVFAGALALSAVSEQSAVVCGLSVLVWCVVGAVPLLRVAPLAVAVAAPVSLLAGWGGRHLWQRAVRRDRRLEPQVVRVLVPLIVGHLFLARVATEGLALQGVTGSDMARVQILRWLGRVAALTVLGYLIAEARGRRRESWGRLLLWPVMVGLFTAELLVATGRAPTDVSSLLVAGGAAVLGATLYYLQRAHVLALLEPHA